MRTFITVCFSLAAACATTKDGKKSGDHSFAMCQIGSHQECDTDDDGEENCTCVPDRDVIEHGPVGPN